MYPDEPNTENPASLDLDQAAALLVRASEGINGGDLRQAEFCLRSIIEGPYQDVPDEGVCSQALERLCALYRQRGAYGDIADVCHGLLKFFPHHVNALYLLGAASQSMGRDEQALGYYQEVLVLAPDHAGAYFNSGILLELAGRYDQAFACYQRVVELRPERAQGYLRLGVIAAQHLGRPHIAREAFRRAVELAPDDAGAQFNLGVFWHRQRDFESAALCYERLLVLDPGNAYVCYLLADIYEMSNRSTDAQRYLERGLAIEPEHPLAHRLAATLLRRQGRVDEAIAELEGVTIPEEDPQLAQGIHFELGRLYDRAKDAQRAYAHFQAGNDLLAQSPEAVVADSEGSLDSVRQLRATFTRDWLAAWREPLGATAQSVSDPIFLVGFTRSGTTLLDQILDSHPALQVIEEREIIGGLCRGLADYPEALGELTPERIMALREQYLAQAAQYLEAGEGDRFVDKMPLNIIDLGLIVRLFPGARIILALRHPCDCCLSCFMQSFVANDAMANFYTLEGAARLYAEVMELWLAYRALLPLNVHQIRYEDLVADLEGEARGLLSFLGLEWDERVLDYNRHARERKQITTPSYNQVTEAIYTRARYRWQCYETQMAPLMPLLAPYIEAFGYGEEA